ncbi:MAG: 4Fe-4S binding protein [Candidatus Omnitrophota bacterium]|nr:4Fe-4S dicluster domain-containing protein [Candidatus Omnitrophota bacterium]MBU2527851.1 4Fe-4S binding protein [bacterium]MBU3929204.1 4Fe-4S binding protein [bacterium]MBU4123748.1 4Fe-4S binding protein [bacterium]
MKRKIIKIDEEKCTGCGNCIPDCPEGALRIIDGKARLVSDLFCDGLGACIGACPVDAIRVEEREAAPYDENKVMENIVRAGVNTIKAHLKHLKEHGETEYLHEAMRYIRENNVDFPAQEFMAEIHGHDNAHAGGGCPGAKAMSWEEKKDGPPQAEEPREKPASELRNWPVQIKLVNPDAPYLKNADILITADCVPFAYASFHRDFVKGKIVLMGCPKLDDLEYYIEKLAEIFKTAGPKSVTVINMEVPCCHGLVTGVQKAIKKSERKIPLSAITVGIKGNIL